jgi:hypothetical protein
MYYDEDTAVLWLFYTESTPYQFRNDTECGSMGHSYPGGQIFVKSSAGTSILKLPTFRVRLSYLFILFRMQPGRPRFNLVGPSYAAQL